MELTINRELQSKCRRWSISASSKQDPNGVFSATDPVEVVIWADTAFVYKIGSNPTTQLPSETTTGDMVWPANTVARIGVPAGQKIAAATVTGTGTIVICPGI